MAKALSSSSAPLALQPPQQHVQGRNRAGGLSQLLIVHAMPLRPGLQLSCASVQADCCSLRVPALHTSQKWRLLWLKMSLSSSTLRNCWGVSTCTQGGLPGLQCNQLRRSQHAERASKQGVGR